MNSDIVIGLIIAIILTWIIGDTMIEKLIGYIVVAIVIVSIIVWTLAILFGGMEILYWIFRGSFFHFM